MLLNASLIAAPLHIGCLIDHDDGGVQRLFASRSEYAEQIDACLADEAACSSLCAMVLYEHGGNTPTGSSKELGGCEVVETRPDGMVLDIAWYPYEDTACGRRPRGFSQAPARPCSAGAWLARIATLEAASVTAFTHLVRSLVRLGAPGALVAGARNAIVDELEHARVTAWLARRRGARVEPPAIAPATEPTPAELALHNAVEGQVGETFGAPVATCQGRLAGDADVRHAFRRIARDETRHAAVSRALAAWLEPQLSRAERDAVRAARREAIAAIRGDFGLTADDRVALGVPDPVALRAAAASAFAMIDGS